MVDVKKVAIGLAAAGGAAALGFYLMQRAQAAPGKLRLKVNAEADGIPLVVPVSVDGQELSTGGYVDLDPGTYTVEAPDAVVDAAGGKYFYKSYELV